MAARRPTERNRARELTTVVLAGLIAIGLGRSASMALGTPPAIVTIVLFLVIYVVMYLLIWRLLSRVWTR